MAVTWLKPAGTVLYGVAPQPTRVPSARNAKPKRKSPTATETTLLNVVGSDGALLPTTDPSDRSAAAPSKPPGETDMATTLLALAGIFVIDPLPHATTVPSARTAKLAPKQPATPMTLLKPGGGRHSLFRFRPHAATGPKVSCASALTATPTSLLATR